MKVLQLDFLGNLQRAIADLSIVVPVKRVKRFPGNENGINSDQNVRVKIPVATMFLWVELVASSNHPEMLGQVTKGLKREVLLLVQRKLPVRIFSTCTKKLQQKGSNRSEPMEKLNEVFLLQIWIGRVSCLESQPHVMQWTMKIQLLHSLDLNGNCKGIAKGYPPGSCKRKHFFKLHNFWSQKRDNRGGGGYRGKHHRYDTAHTVEE